MRFFFLVVLCGLVVPQIARGELVEKEFTHQFGVEEGVTLQVRHGDGDVLLTPWDRDEVDVVVRYRADETTVGLGGSPELDVEFGEGEGVVRITERMRGGVTIGYQSRDIKEYTYTIQAPPYLILELRGDDGDVRIGGWAGEMKIDLEDGDLWLTDIAAPRMEIRMEDGDSELIRIKGELFFEGEDGDISVIEGTLPKARLRVEDGDISVKDVAGNFDIEAEDGEIRLGRVRAGGLLVRSEDGDVDLELLRGEVLDLDVEVEDGSVGVSLQSGMNATFSLRTEDGDLTVDYPGVRNLSHKENRITGEMGDGNGSIHIQTESGDVTLRTWGEKTAD